MSLGNDFQQVAIGDCCEIVSGSTPSRLVGAYWNGDINWFTPKDLSRIKSKYVVAAPEKITQLGLTSCSTRLLPKKSLLLSSRAPIGHLAINAQETCTNQGFKSLIPNDNLDVEYLYYAIKNIVPQLQDMGNGATFKEISKAILSKVKIPLPTLAQQQKIAAILDAADSLRQKDQQLVQRYTALSQSLFLEMFGDPVTNPMGWGKKTLSQFISNLDTGVSVNSTDADYQNTQFGILKTSCVYSGIFSPEQAKVIRDDEFERAKLNPKADSIIISRMNTPELVGKSAYIERDFPMLFLPDRLWQSEKSGLEYSVRWLAIAISFNSFMKEISKIASGTSGSMKNISKGKFLALPMTYPSPTLQNEFAERVQLIEAQKQQAQRSLAKSEALFSSLLQQAFTGELTNKMAA